MLTYVTRRGLLRIFTTWEKQPMEGGSQLNTISGKLLLLPYYTVFDVLFFQLRVYTLELKYTLNF